VSGMVEKLRQWSNTGTSRVVLGSLAFSGLAVAAEAAAIISSSVVTGAVYHLWAYGDVGDVRHYMTAGGLVALLYTLPFLMRDDYQFHKLLEQPRSLGRVFLVWNYAFVTLATLGFLTKTSDIFSRGGLVLFYGIGLIVLVGLSSTMRLGVRYLLSKDRIERRRVMIVGAADEIGRLQANAMALHSDFRVAAAIGLPEFSNKGGARDAADASLAGAVAKARALHIEDIVIFTDWSKAAQIQHIIAAFQALPVGIHLGASNVIGPFSDARISRFASTPAVSLTAPPLGTGQRFMKRAVDLVLASAGLLLLAPVFAIVALAIKTNSPGPVFFRQRRRGYNHREFRIWKFRTMNTMEDGMSIPQAKPNDARVTWTGRLLRRTSIDELPQLLNVLAGEMSLVGPRPHAIAHDELYEVRIPEYARRSNVRPGITGWAQVNGCRGATSTDEAMRRRVDHDLYYIDNWSVLLDLYIIALTVLSPKTFRNAH
jgi:polysaccharide biosynthesis protein PslA